jgi:hypothetical protein
MLYIKRNILFYHITSNCRTFLTFLFQQSPPKCLEIRGIYDVSKKELSAAQASEYFSSTEASVMETCGRYETSKLH